MSQLPVLYDDDTQRRVLRKIKTDDLDFPLPDAGVNPDYDIVPDSDPVFSLAVPVTDLAVLAPTGWAAFAFAIPAGTTHVQIKHF